jgi:hypothetical protein
MSGSELGGYAPDHEARREGPHEGVAYLASIGKWGSLRTSLRGRRGGALLQKKSNLSGALLAVLNLNILPTKVH